MGIGTLTFLALLILKLIGVITLGWLGVVLIPIGLSIVLFLLQLLFTGAVSGILYEMWK